jgi:4'-phosphopantetheinyl transferase
VTTTPEDRDVHLWVVRLDASAALRAAAAHLAADEVARARRIASPEHGRRFTAARGALRAILGACLDRPPGSLAFAYGPGGKPALAGADAGRLHFNLSHSHEVAPSVSTWSGCAR